MDQRSTVFVIFDGFQPLDMVGPHEVFSHAAGLGGGYVCEVVAPRRAWSGRPAGCRCTPGTACQDSGPAGVDTLVVAGGSGVDLARHDRALVDWIAAAGARARRVTSVCSGVFLLAAAGLLAGRTGHHPLGPCRAARPASIPS